MAMAEQFAAPQTPSAKSIINASRTAARLAAVQALYQNSYQPNSPDILAENILGNMLDGEYAPPTQPDTATFRRIIEGVAQNQEHLIEVITGNLNAKLSWQRLDVVLRMILLAGSFEIIYCQEIPPSIIMNDYVDITKSFWQGRESGLVNGVLNQIADKTKTV